MRLAALTVLFGLLLLPQEQTQPVPRFRSGVDVVLLDVTVLDAVRRPARGLKASDFTILENGKPQPIVSFDEVDSPEPDGALVPWMREVPPDVRTNTADDRRLVLIVLDDANISLRHRPQVKAIGRKVVDQLGPADQAAVIYTGSNGKSQEFTGNRRLLRAAIERFAETPVAGLEKRYSIDTIHRAVETLVAVRHRRKAMIFVSSLTVDLMASDDIAFRLREALRRAQKANVTIYPVNPAGLQVDIDTEEGRDAANETARMIASQTGGFAVVNRNALGAEIQQIFRETGSYYLIGFQSPHRDGRFRRIEVKVSRPGFTARTRAGYEAPSAEKERKADKTLPLIKALASVVPTPDIPMRVAVAPFATPGRAAASVAIVLGLSQPVPGGERLVESVELLSTAFTMHHRRAATQKQIVALTLRPTPDAADAKYEILTKLELPPGRYNLRFAVHNASLGKSGSVYEEIEIPDFRREAVSLSGVVVGVSPALPSAPPGLLASVVPVVPSTQRVFLKAHRPTALLRVYQGGRRPRVPIALATTIVNEQDATIHAVTDTLEAARFSGEGGVEHRFNLPVDRLEPGAYLLRFQATAAAKAVTREVRFVVR